MGLDPTRTTVSPVGDAEICPLARKRATQRTALAMLTPNRLAAALRDIPSSTTAPTTRSRRSSESAIPAASFRAATILKQIRADSGIPLAIQFARIPL